MVDKTKYFRTAVTTILKTCCANVYYDHAKANAEFPYAVFSTFERSRTDGTVSAEIDVNVIDYGDDTEQCEAISDAVQDALDHAQYTDANIYFVSYQETRKPVQEEDKKVIRRRLTFDVRLYERG